MSNSFSDFEKDFDGLIVAIGALLLLLCLPVPSWIWKAEKKALHELSLKTSKTTLLTLGLVSLLTALGCFLVWVGILPASLWVIAPLAWAEINSIGGLSTAGGFKLYRISRGGISNLREGLF